MLDRKGKIRQKAPTVKKASEYVSAKSNKHKKYISLMLVPSYSGGRTRSLQLPRFVFMGMAALAILAVAAIAGFYIRSAHHMRIAEDLSLQLYETEEALTDVIEETIRMQDEIADSVEQLLERHLLERQLLERRHNYALEDIWDLIEEIERRIGDLQGSRQEALSELQALSFIPAVAAGLEALEAAHEAARRVPVPGEFVELALHGYNGEAALVSRLYGIELDLFVEEILRRELQLQMEAAQLYIANYPTIKPVLGEISSGFGMRTTVFNRSLHMHRGVDIPAPTGTPVLAAGGGTVYFAGWIQGYGNTVIIDHGIGITTLYAHNSRILVATGDEVLRGQRIALVGSTGQSTGPHVHYEVRVDGVAVNPVDFFLADWEGRDG